MENISGFLLINKPKGISSFDCIRHLKKILGKKIKIGHAGTLDPFATGLLIIAIGKLATKQIKNFIELNKIYIATGKLGELTDTLDLTGKILNRSELNITKNDIEESIKKIGSSYEQIPPIFSAAKYKGDPLYKLARSNSMSDEKLLEVTSSKSKIVQIYKLKLLKFDFPFFSVEALVNHGTYIRCLINDIAKISNNFATTYELIRIKIGQYDIKNSIELNDITSIVDIQNNII